MLLGTASGDGAVRVFDLRAKIAGPVAQPVAAVGAGGEVLSLDWNKYRPLTLASGSTDRVIKTWDLRSLPGAGKAGSLPAGTPSAVLMGHTYAVREVAWSPHKANVLASASYDMTARIWDVDDAQSMASAPTVSQARYIYAGHSEFVVGLAWSLFQPGLIASTSWDTSTQLWIAPV